MRNSVVVSTPDAIERLQGELPDVPVSRSHDRRDALQPHLPQPPEGHSQPGLCGAECGV